MVSLTKSGHNIGEHLVASGFAAAGGANDHDTETHVEGLVQVDNLLHKASIGLPAELAGRG